MYTYGITGTSLDEFRDTTIVAVADGQVLKYNSTTSQWENVDPSTLNIALDNLSDVSLTSPEEFQVLEFDGTSWINKHASVTTYVRNADSVTLGTGTVVYLFGATGDHASVKRADNDSDTTSSKTVGLVAAPIDPNENGTVVTRGYVDGIDLSVGYAPGDILWLGEDGGFTKVKPTAPEHLVFVGVVVRATNNGIVYVAVQNGYELGELHDVKINGSLADDDVLQYDSVTGTWKNTALSALGLDLGDISGNYVEDVDAGTGISVSHTPSAGSTATVSLNAAVNDLSDATITSAARGNALIYDGSAWVNRSGAPANDYQTPVDERRYVQLGGVLTVVSGANVGSATHIVFRSACEVDELSVFLQVGYAGATTYSYRLGAYRDNGGVPGALIVDAGTLSIATGATVGYKTLSITPFSVAAGEKIWFVCAATHFGAVPGVAHVAGHLQPYADYGIQGASQSSTACFAYLTAPATALPDPFVLNTPQETQPAGVAVYAKVNIP